MRGPRATTIGLIELKYETAFGAWLCGDGDKIRKQLAHPSKYALPYAWLLSADSGNYRWEVPAVAVQGGVWCENCWLP
ncbi:hypothetical protein GCM10023194_78190 [Planotetraspora phitsanulokensis]|uniref:Uncharacterized protein n=1 Tax=Planotetraspora phitsanulokensis TaxID=575192 RepID=A0A8J3XHG3_9ACTN|nr:hypothetical protein Pph01_61080 [Planotetraspora phitsanulokensis]